MFEDGAKIVGSNNKQMEGGKMEHEYAQTNDIHSNLTPERPLETTLCSDSTCVFTCIFQD